MSINLGFFGCAADAFTGTALPGELELDKWDVDVSKEEPVPTK